MQLFTFLCGLVESHSGDIRLAASTLLDSLSADELYLEIGSVKEAAHTRSPGVDLGEEFVETDIPGITIDKTMWSSLPDGTGMFKGKPNTQYVTCIGSLFTTDLKGFANLIREETAKMPEEFKMPPTDSCRLNNIISVDTAVDKGLLHFWEEGTGGPKGTYDFYGESLVGDEDGIIQCSNSADRDAIEQLNGDDSSCMPWFKF